MIIIALTRLGIVTASGKELNAAWPVNLDGAITDRPYEWSAEKQVLADPAWIKGDGRTAEDKHFYRATPDDVCRIFIVSDNEGRQTAIAMTHSLIFRDPPRPAKTVFWTTRAVLRTHTPRLVFGKSAWIPGMLLGTVMARRLLGDELGCAKNARGADRLQGPKYHCRTGGSPPNSPKRCKAIPDFPARSRPHFPPGI